MIRGWDYPESWDGLDAYYAELESFESHYADEIEGRAEYLESPLEETPALRNAPGQLQFSFGVAYR